MNLKKMLAGVCLLLITNLQAWATPIEILTNGDFATGDLSSWTQSDPITPLEWGVTSAAPIGAYFLESSDGSFFASPWEEGPNPQTTTLFQRVDLATLSATLLGTFTFSAEAIYANDRITLGYELYDTNLNLLASQIVFTGLGGPSANNQSISQTFSLVSDTRYISFIATGELINGSYIDAGFDNASILMEVRQASAVSSPHALMLFVLGMIGVASVNRIKKSKD
ncbi:hypothetical protein [Glaciecola sp. 1036]|uniref:hypothetical protein n=1 Tax=Alteromonadaceae TaxID=72275 RepID=UPI003CFF949A